MKPVEPRTGVNTVERRKLKRKNWRRYFLGWGSTNAAGDLTGSEWYDPIHTIFWLPLAHWIRSRSTPIRVTALQHSLLRGLIGLSAHPPRFVAPAKLDGR